MKRYIVDGKVALLYSPGFGAGWSTWCHDEKYREDMVFCPEIAKAVHTGEGDLYEIARRLFPDQYMGGVGDLSIYWLEQGTRFIIREYDGSESVQIISPETGYVA